MLTATPVELQERAERLAARCPASLAPAVVPGASAVGGGAFPDAVLPTSLISLDPSPLGPDGFALRLRLGDPPVVARVSEGRVLLDPRTLVEPFEPLLQALAAAADQ